MAGFFAIAGAAGAGVQPAAANPSPADEFAARSITRLALMDLRGATQPTPDDYRITAILLGAAQRLTPADQEIVRRRLEAAWSAGDNALVEELTRRIVELDPADTVAQLRLIVSRIGSLQTAEDRLRAYENLLGPAGAKLDAAVRSRLALDAALLLREKGDMNGFVEKLTLATTLDPSHKEAATLAVTYFSERVDDPRGRLDLLANLLLADPIDPNVHLTIARALASGGAFESAQRFHANASAILAAASGITSDVALESLILTWHVKGPRAVIDQLDRELLVAQDHAAQTIRRLERNNMPTDRVQRPEQIRLTPAFERVRLLAADSTGDRAAVDAMIAEMAFTSNALMKMLADPSSRPAGLDEEELRHAAATAMADLQSYRLWTGSQVGEAKAAIAEGAPLREEILALAPDLESWVMLRFGDAAGAAERFAPAADGSTLAAVGLAVAYEQLGRKQEAADQYRRIVEEGPLTLAGVWSSGRLAVLTNTKRPLGDPTPLDEFARSVPSWIDQMAVQPDRFVRMSVDLIDRTISASGRAGVRLTLQNISMVPLALGTDRAINSRFLLAPKLDSQFRGVPALAQPEVVDVDRRLRLMPREQISVTVWPDPGVTGWLLECVAFQTMRVRWRAIQGFTLDPDGAYRPGVMCLQTETGSMVREPMLEARLSPGELAERFRTDPEHSLGRVAAALRALLVAGPTPQGGFEVWSPAIEAAAARYPTLDPRTRAMLLAVLPHATLAPVMAPFDEVVRAETDPLPLLVLLATRVTDAADPILSTAQASQDADVRRMAELIGARLGRDGRWYAELTRGDLWVAPGQAQDDQTPR